MKNLGCFKKFLSAFSALALFTTTLTSNLILVSANENVSTKEAISFESSMNYGGEKDDSYKGVAATNDGGFVVAGYSLSSSESPAWSHLGTTSSNDAIVVKYNAGQEVEWSKNYGTTSTDIFFDVDVLKDGTIVCVGQSKKTCDGQTTADVCMYICLINPENPEDYQEIFLGGKGGDYATSVVATSDGGFAIAGYSASLTANLWKDKKNISSSEAIVVKYNANREAQWCSVSNAGISMGIETANLKRSKFFGITEDNNGDIIAVGDVQLAKNLYNATIVKFSGTDGSELWTRSVGSTLTEAPEDAADYYTGAYESVEVLSDNSIIAVGYTKAEASSEEGFSCVGTEDGIYAKYSSDGSLITADNIGTIDGTLSFTGIYVSDSDEVYLYGSTDSVIKEDYIREKGYTWDNYGAHDAIIINYDSDMNVNWSANYGGENSEYINGFFISSTGEAIAVGEATSTCDGNINLKNNGKVDAIVLSSNYHESTSTESILKDGKVPYADGTYVDSANGYSSVITVSVEIENGEIKSVSEVSANDTKAFYNLACALYNTIVEANSADVDVVSGATLSSNGIKNATANALSQSMAKTVVNAIDDLGTITEASADAVTNARAAYNQLGTYARTYVTNYETLVAAEETLISLTNGAYVVDYGTTSDTEEANTETSETNSDEASTENYFDEDGNLTEEAAKTIIGSAVATNDIYYCFQNDCMKTIQWNAFRNKKITGANTTIAVIDTGLTTNHEDIDYSHILTGHNYVDGTDITTDTDGHGTAIVGILQASSNNGKGIAGILSEADIVPLKVSGRSSDISQVTAAIYDAVDVYNVDVITMSFGFEKTESNEEEINALEAAVNYAADKGVILVAAAGNKADSTYLYPAAFENVVGVGYTNEDGTINAKSKINDSVYVVAPGTNIYQLAISKRMKCEISSGSSYAAPIVAAMAVAAKSVDNSIDTDKFKNLLKETSTDLGAEGYDTSYGYGLVNFESFASALVASVELVVITDSKLLLATNTTNLASDPDSSESNTISITGLTSLELNLGDTKTVYANVIPTNANNTDVVWYSSNSDVVSVDNGLLTANATGSAVVAAISIDGAKIDQIKVTVVDPNAISTGEIAADEEVVLSDASTDNNTVTSTDSSNTSTSKSSNTGDNLFLQMALMLVIMGLSARLIYLKRKKIN